MTRILVLLATIAVGANAHTGLRRRALVQQQKHLIERNPTFDNLVPTGLAGGFTGQVCVKLGDPELIAACCAATVDANKVAAGCCFSLESQDVIEACCAVCADEDKAAAGCVAGTSTIVPTSISSVSSNIATSTPLVTATSTNVASSDSCTDVIATTTTAQPTKTHCDCEDDKPTQVPTSSNVPGSCKDAKDHDGCCNACNHSWDGCDSATTGQTSRDVLSATSTVSPTSSGLLSTVTSKVVPPNSSAVHLSVGYAFVAIAVAALFMGL